MRLDAHWFDATLRPGTCERVLLASDGLAVLDESAVTGCLGAADPAEAASALVDASLAAGAPDNVTVLVVDVAVEAKALA